MGNSEVARLRKQIETECTAMFHASAYAQVSSHTFIEARAKVLNQLSEELGKYLPPDQVTEEVCNAYMIAASAK